MLTVALALNAYSAAKQPNADSDWAVKKLQFSAVTIGVACTDDKNCWSSFTDGGSGIKITKSTDGGDTFTPVQNQSNVIMVMGIDLSTDPSLDIVTTGMASTTHSSDGNTFKGGRGAPFVSQSIKASSDGRVAIAAPDGACLSSDGGVSYKCHKIPFKYGPQGRYISSPSADVIYVTAGSWPTQQAPSETEHQITKKLRLSKRVFDSFDTGASTQWAFERDALSDPPSPPPPTTGYTAELWKSADGGATWTSLLSDEGNFYFNDIDCLDEKTCVAVAEGFGQDGSQSPGARVYTTSDGQTFKLAHQETTDGTSLMAVKMLSATEHHVGGELAPGTGLHTTDGGATYTNVGTKIKGQMITSMSFPSDTHGFATTVNSLQICSLLEYGSA